MADWVCGYAFEVVNDGRTLFHEKKYTLTAFITAKNEEWVDNPLRMLICIEGAIVGTISAYWEDGSIKRWLEFGVCLYDESWWGKGIATESCEQWFAYLWNRFVLSKEKAMTLSSLVFYVLNGVTTKRVTRIEKVS